VTALKAVGVSLAAAELTTLMAEFDAHADGGVDYKEFLRTFVDDYSRLGVDGVLLNDFSRTTGFISQEKRENMVRLHLACEPGDPKLLGRS
jgi:hypothetical protein